MAKQNSNKILHLTSSLKIGGAESLLVSLLASLNNYNNYLIYFNSGPNLEKINNLNLNNLKIYKIKNYLFKYDFFYFYYLYKLIKTIKPDLIHSSLWSANFISKFLGYLLNIPVVSTIHSSNIKNKNLLNKFSNNFRNYLDKLSFLLLKKYDYLINKNILNNKYKYINIIISKSAAQIVIKEQSWLKINYLKVINNGINLNIKNLNINKNLNKNLLLNLNLNNYFVIGSVGRLTYSKNFKLLIKTSHKLNLKYKNIYLIIIGSGELKQKLEDYAKSLNFKNFKIISSNNAISYYKYFNVFAQPSFQEGLSIALLEAACFSLPCIASFNIKIKTKNSYVYTHDLIKNNHSGFLIDPENILKNYNLYNSLNKIILNEKLRPYLGNNINKTASKDFSFARMKDGYLNIYKKFL